MLFIVTLPGTAWAMDYRVYTPEQHEQVVAALEACRTFGLTVLVGALLFLAVAAAELVWYLMKRVTYPHCQHETPLRKLTWWW